MAALTRLLAHQSKGALRLKTSSSLITRQQCHYSSSLSLSLSLQNQPVGNRANKIWQQSSYSTNTWLASAFKLQASQTQSKARPAFHLLPSSRPLSSSGSGGGGKMSLIKQLREESGAPVTEVKTALEAAGWDIEKAHVELRKRGIAQAEKKKSKRVASEGLVALAANEASTKVALVEVNCETDFVSRNDAFQGLAGQAAQALLATEAAGKSLSVSSSDILALEISSSKGEDEATTTIEEAVTNVGLGVREKLELRRGHFIQASSSDGVVSGYLHMSPAPGLGSIGAAVCIEAEDLGEGAEDKKRQDMLDLGKKVAMHVAATNPLYLDESHIPEDVLMAEKDVLMNQPGVKQKPPHIIEKMVKGRLNKYFKQVTLLNQPFVMDDTLSVKQFVDRQGKELGLSLSISQFARFKVGEGIEKKTTKTFAEEVADLQ